MSNDHDDNVEVSAPDELTSLKARADQLGIRFHPSISLEKLREKVTAALTSDGPADDGADDSPVVAAPVKETEGQMRQRIRDQAGALVRVNITCMNPAKREWDGEIFTTGNSIVGTYKKMVPFNTTDGWHVPQIILDMIKERQCQIFVEVRDGKGNKVRKGKLIKEFAIDVLPQLTKSELDELARRQAMSHAID